MEGRAGREKPWSFGSTGTFKEELDDKAMGFFGEEKAQHRRSKIWSQRGTVNGFCRELLHSGRRV